MTRTIVLALAAAMLLAGASAISAAQAQQKLNPVELDQLLLDKWISIAPDLIKMTRATQAAPETIDQYFPRWRKMCAEAGFASFEQCQDVTGYIGMILGSFDRRTRSFRDPVVQMRRQLTRLEADAGVRTAEREGLIAQLKEVLAGLPERLPREHLELMTANRDRVFQAMLPAEQ